MGAPKEIMSGFFWSRLLETEDKRPLRIHAAKHVANDAVLAGGIERLQCDQERLIPVCVKKVLQLVLRISPDQTGRRRSTTRT